MTWNPNQGLGVTPPSEEQMKILNHFGITDHTIIIPDSIVMICEKIKEIDERLKKIERELCQK
jgi:hypothetical protein